jgi:hypothetical protein
MTEEQLFKQCSACGRKWKTRTEFLRDPELCLVGYQANFLQLEAGFVFFNHDAVDCGTTLAVQAGAFRDLYDGPIFEYQYRGEPDCPGYCLDREELAACDLPCECAYVRTILKIIQNWPKCGTRT